MSVARRLPPGSRLPKLVVFDLDNTLWLPELYQHNKRQRGRPPVADQDVKLLPGAVNALREMLTCEEWQGCDIAVASRTNQGDWARALLESFPAPGADASRSLASVIKYQEIYTGTKIPHFRSLQSSSGLDFSDMLFFDDSRGGRYGNCEPVAALGVCSAHCPDGLTDEVWAHSVRAYAALQADGKHMGVVIPADGGAPEAPPGGVESGGSTLTGAVGNGAEEARVVRFFADKRFGFVQRASGGKDVFFHLNALPAGARTPRTGDRVTVTIGKDRKGKLACTTVLPQGAAATDATATPDGPTVTLPCFSMNMPFAGLVAHGRKTLETRNHTMFEGTAGTKCLLHVGQRTYPDGGKHRAILAAAGDSEADIDRLTSLPAPFERGSVVALLDLGETVLEPLDVRSTDAIQSAACALGADMGRYLTTVKAAAFLKAAVPMRGKPGLFTATVPLSALPDGWDVQADAASSGRPAKQKEAPRIRQTYG